MPQITVDYSDNLADGFDRPAFARDLHSAVVDIAAAKPPACKTRFRRTEDPVVGPDSEGHALVHVHIALLAGRTDETKSRLTEAVLDLLRQYVKPADGRTLHASAEVRDLDPSYRKFEGE
ncbi:5-carboxymethyl-2-hydroxymuconate Delta-isomerase [Streptomyces althioticus]|jgi:5-carboxymethyl-2-hydroxymuconate isomerase|uniref:Isomerase n=1 Tax=Streptomyces griseorubens TaxID=66897 RepID=A0ABR4T5P0_9ACTN|nr:MULTISPECIES: 5-carboxymethyl-2-hydroxymuconate Delta-isomerase [Actinomycetes]ALV49860.1 isomerase [Streptomyces sp. 4F]MCC9685717.1 5-carboxymethyl-2-hydroxymuconate Delta-isomerase [Streptomyces sp. MNU103]WTC25558.1 5-carboxymethyl-2-hydroxymuconate Delta-isomerase [Streptomyces althioticus]GGT50189.1 isomerase [Streptomyces matensis]KEG42570.1 isomerase [Streptomyces griseorubens]